MVFLGGSGYRGSEITGRGARVNALGGPHVGKLVEGISEVVRGNWCGKGERVRIHSQPWGLVMAMR